MNKNYKFTACPKQSRGDGRIPKNPDCRVTKDSTNPSMRNRTE